jgi:aminoglycoside/choline kinase family phosphotransferase
MTQPRSEIRRYLGEAAPGASVEPLAGDASTRRFYRIHLPDGSTRVLMDYGAPLAAEPEDLSLNRIFRAADLPVAEILEVSMRTGCLILQDLGDTTLETLILDPSGKPAVGALSWMERAVRLATRIADRGSAALEASSRAEGPVLDGERFRFEMDHFLAHFAGSLRGVFRTRPELREELHLLANLAAHTPRRVMCHRDFHSRNLLVREDGQVFLVDIQDARWGPDSYDLASLLRDAYVEIDESWVEPLIKAYCSGLPRPPDPHRFRQRFDLVAAQRMIKALGTFGHQIAVRGNRRYLDAARRTITRLRGTLPASEQTGRLAERMSAAGLLDEI